MRALLDISVLVALLDASHVKHEAARGWLLGHSSGWASCPLTQNGCARVMSQPTYPAKISTFAVLARLQEATEHRSHEFWPDEISLLDSDHVSLDRILGPRQLTDIYLLALAVAHNGTFVTLDARIQIDAVLNATPTQLIVL